MQRRLTYSIFFVFLLLHSIPAYPDSYRITHYTLADGLPSSQVLSLAEDKLGYLWIGTLGAGLSRFDGKEFFTYTKKHGLPDDFITSIKPDREGNIWIGTLKGITKFDGHTFSRILSDKMSGDDLKIRQIELFNNAIFFVTQSGSAGKISGDIVTWIKTPFLISRIFPESNRTLYFLTKSGILKKMHDQKFAIEIPNDLSINGFMVIGGESLMSTNKGFFRIAENKIIKMYPGITTDPMFVEPGDSVLWTLSDIPKKVRLNGEKIENESLFKNITNVTKYLRDSEGGIWIGTFSNGLWHIVSSEFDKVYENSGSEAPVFPIERLADNSIYLGTNGDGLVKISNDGKIAHIKNADHKRNYVFDLAKTPDGLWIGTYGGLGIYNGKSIEWIADSTGNSIDLVLALELDSANGLWVGRGGSRIDRIRKHRVLKINTEGLNGGNINALKYSSGDSSLYIGSDKGLYVLKCGKIEKIAHLEGIHINSLDIFMDTRLIIGTSGAGLQLLDVGHGPPLVIDEQYGLSSDLVSFVKAEGKAIWVGTSRGINKLEFDDEGVTSIRKYNHLNGFIGVEANSNGYFIDEKIKLFSSSDGVYKFVDLEDKKLPDVELHLREVALFYGEQNARQFSKTLYSQFFQLPLNPQFPSNLNHLTFKFNLVSKVNPDRIKFKTKLDGLESDWSPISNKREVIYSALPPGNYTLRVLALDELARKPVDELDYTFSIKYPFYKTVWFSVSMFALISLIIIALFYLKINQKVKKLAMLERIRNEQSQSLRQEMARDFHDEMGNHLAKVVSYVDVLKVNPNSVDSGKILAKIEQSVKFINLGTRDFIWSINPQHNNSGSLFFYLRDFSERLFKNSSIAFKSFYELREEWNISHKSVREIILIFKEALTNVLKHSNARTVTFSLFKEDSSIQFILRDDGIGFLSEKTTRSGGIVNIQYRANKINARLSIDSNPGKGTQINLALDITNHKP